MQDALLFFAAANFLIFALSVLGCWALGVTFQKKRLFERNEPLRPGEIAIAFLAVLLNTGISIVGWWLWRQGWITLTEGSLLIAIRDCGLMLMAMDFGMYVTHRIAHLPILYSWIHRLHHRHESTNPISLFVLHPLEVIGFGALMIAFLVLYPMSVTGLLIYLFLNIVFGTLGHTGVEPFPAVFRKIPFLKYLGTSTFHAEHHEHPGYNFGFYTLIWDKLFGTLDPEYEHRFSHSGQPGATASS